MEHKLVFVARRREIAELYTFLNQAVNGRGQICFITGEAGSGKTALVLEFINRALKIDHDLVVAIGQSDSQTGMGDPYLPFREILAQLTGDVEPKLTQGVINEENANRLQKILRISGEALIEIGPELVGVFLPAAGLLARAATFAADKAGWFDELNKISKRSKNPDILTGTQLEQKHILEQYTNLLRVLAIKHPLILVLEDLHWADIATIELLFRIGRRIASERILVIGTYRPDELAYGRAGEHHPLEKVITEFKRYHGDIFIELGQTSVQEKRTFIDAFLDTEPNRLGSAFRKAFFKRTGGHPLFVIELLRNMQERGDLVKDEGGCWIEGEGLSWDSLPTRVEGVIEERVGRLADELRQVLNIGSVEGENFTAEVIAHIQSQEIRHLIISLSTELDRKHHLISAQGIQQIGTNRLSLYRFNHNLFQHYIYLHLDSIERTYLHEEIGLILEELFCDQRDRIALQLAHHFDKAGLNDKTRYYMHLAGDQAAQRYANEQALTCYSRALELTSQDDISERFDLLLARGKIHHLLGAVLEEQADLGELQLLAHRLNVSKLQAEVALLIANFEESRGNYESALNAVKESIRHAKVDTNQNLEAKAYLVWGHIFLQQGNYSQALSTLEKGLHLAQRVDAREIEAGCLQYIAIVYWRQGKNDQAQDYFEKALNLFRVLDNRIGESQVISNLGNIHLRKEEYDKARNMYEKSLRIERSIGNRRGECASLGNLGIILCKQGDFSNAKQYFEQVFQISEEIGNREGAARALGNLGGLLSETGNYSEASKAYNQALINFRDIGNRQAECWILADSGFLLHCLGDELSSKELNHQALLIAQEIGNKFFESVALNNLGHSWLALKQYEKAFECFEHALEIQAYLDLQENVIQSKAGLAAVSLAKNDLIKANILIKEIIPALSSTPMSSTEGKMYVYLTCYRVLLAAHDAEANQVLSNAYDIIQKDAAKLSDEDQRRLLLENVPSYKEILSLVKQNQ